MLIEKSDSFKIIRLNIRDYFVYTGGSILFLRWMKTEMEVRRNICKHLNKYTLYTLGGGCNFVLAITASPNYNEQIRIWRIRIAGATKWPAIEVVPTTDRCKSFNISLLAQKCSVDKDSLKQGLTPISFRQTTTELTLGKQVSQGVFLLFPNGLRAHFGSGSEK